MRTFHHPVGNVHLTRTWSSTKPNLGAEYTEMALSDGESAMTLHHYFYGAWPDHGVPEGKAVAQLSALVREVREKAEREGCEVWVHWLVQDRPQAVGLGWLSGRGERGEGGGEQEKES